jgi:hypothetical protein
MIEAILYSILIVFLMPVIIVGYCILTDLTPKNRLKNKNRWKDIN